MAKAKTVTIDNVELLKPGVWNGRPISRQDIDGMAAAFAEVGDALPIPLQLGHDARQGFATMLVKAGILTADEANAAVDDDGDDGGMSGWPGIGKVSALSVRDDGMLLGRFTSVPEQLAAWVKNGAYRERSVTLWPRKVIGGKVYHWWLHNVSLLGDTPPAVDGLAALGLATGLPADAMTVQFSASDADGLLALADGQGAGDAGQAAETALDKLVTGLTAQFDEYAPLVYGRKGAVASRTLFTAFLGQLRTTARAEMPLSAEGGNPMKLTLEALRGVLRLAADADAAAIVAALNAGDDATAQQVVTLAAGDAPAGGMGSFATADQLVGWLAGALGVAPGDLDGVAAKIVALMTDESGEPPDAAEAAGETAQGGVGMSATKAPATVPVAVMDQSKVELAALYTNMAADMAAVKLELASSKAAAKVDADAKARGLSLPVPVRGVLIELAVAGNDAAYAAVLGNTTSVPTGEQGSGVASGEEVVTLSAADKAIARMSGISEADMLAQKQADAKANEA